MLNKNKIEKINILFVAWPYYIGGAEIALMNIIKNLNPTIFNHIVIFPAMGEAVELFKSHKIKIKIMPMERWNNTRGQLLDFIREHRINLVYTNTVHVFEAAMAAKLAGIGHIWHMHGRLDSVFPKLKPLQIRKALGLIYFLSTKIIVCSKYAKMQFRDIDLNNKVITINCGIDLNDFSVSKKSRNGLYKTLDIRKDDFLVGMISRLDPQKRPQDFIEAAMLVKKKFQKVKFVLMGSGPNRKYMAKIKKINSQSGSPVAILGFCENVSGVMRSLDVLVLPSVGDASPLVILEAMACGKPVIAANSGGIPEMISHRKTGILIPPKRLAALASAIEELLNIPSKAKSMGKLGRLRVEKFYNIREIAQKLQDILLSTIQRKNENNKF